MRYAKPELTELSAAIAAIQSGVQKTETFIDNVNLNHPMNATSAAYEADE